MKKKYHVQMEYVAHHTFVVEADNIKEATEKAREMNVPKEDIELEDGYAVFAEGGDNEKWGI